LTCLATAPTFGIDDDDDDDEIVLWLYDCAIVGDEMTL